MSNDKFTTSFGLDLPVDFDFWDSWTVSIMDQCIARKFNRSSLSRAQRYALIKFVEAGKSSWFKGMQSRILRSLEKTGMIICTPDCYYRPTALGIEYVCRFVKRSQ